MPEQLTFYPLDVSYKLKNDRAIIHIYGKTADGRKICVTDPNFQPYFYIKPKGDAHQLTKDLLNCRVPMNDDRAEVVDVKPIEKNLHGKPIKLLKVFTKLPQHVPIIKQEISTHPAVAECFEYDILFARRYVMDSDLTPLLSAKATGTFVTERSKVPIFEAEKIEAADEDLFPDMNLLAFDIETYNPDGKGMNTEKHPILMIALFGKNLKKVITWKRFPTINDNIEFVAGEFELISRFKELVEQAKPDIITGYYSDGFDFPYIIERARKYKIPLDLGLDHSTIDFNRRSGEVKITGIVHLDIYQFIKKVLSRSLVTDSLKLDAVAAELLGERKHEIDIAKLAEDWDNGAALEKYCNYNLHDARLTYLLCQKILPNMEEMVKIVGLPLFVVSRMSFSQLVESYIFTQAKDYNEVAPNKPGYKEATKRRSQTFEGAFVFEPTPGLYSGVVIFDFRSLYPSIITSHNISPSSLRCDCCHDLIPGQEDWFCQNKKGFLSAVLEDIITRRMRVTQIIKTSPEKNQLLQARSNALKLLANSFYGYLGFAPARWYSFESARSVTALGRYHINEVIKNATSSGFDVLYSDTDSLFIKLREKTKEDALRFVDAVNAHLPGLMELEYQGFYPAALFVSAKAGAFGAKKKYALLDEKGIVKIKGFEAIRRNWSIIAKEVQQTVLGIILKEKDNEKALQFVKDIVAQLRNRTIPVDKVVISTQLQKPIGAYGSIGPHVAAAQRMIARGITVVPRSIISYVIALGKGPLRDKTKLPDEIKDNDYDAEYYVNNQILPSINRIFDVLGIDVDEMVNKKQQQSLGKYFV